MDDCAEKLGQKKTGFVKNARSDRSTAKNHRFPAVVRP